MTPLVDQVLDEIQGAWRHRWLALGTAVVLALVGWLVVFSLPDLYEAEAKVFVDTGTALTPVLQGLAVEQDVNAQLNYVRQSLLAGPQLVKIARDSGVLPASVTDPARQNRILDQFSSRVFIDVVNAGDGGQDQNAAGTIYDIRYRDGNRARSLQVVGTLLHTLVSETLGGKQAGAQSAQNFLAVQIQDYAKRLSAAEDRLAAFKKANLGLMPTEQGGYFAELQTELQAVSDDEIKIQKARTRRDVLEAQLHGNAAIAAVGAAEAGANGAGGTGGNDINSLIAEAQARLDELRLRFTDKHPDVIAAKEILAELKQRRAAELESLRKGDADAAAITGAGSNPVYESIEQELNQTELEMADLDTDLAQHRKKSADLRVLLNTAPQVEAQYEQLTRDYAANTAEYNALLEKDEKARLGQRADDAGSVQFNVVQPPTADFAPVWPRRARWLGGVLVLALLAGGGLAYGLHQLRPVIYSATGLTQLTGARVLGVVGSANPSFRKRASRRDAVRIAVAFGCFVLAFAVALLVSAAGVRLS
jgi:polysaccharide chain length determinant protein (PEP-CTERM system associated)